jgi:hypothetical protein
MAYPVREQEQIIKIFHFNYLLRIGQFLGQKLENCKKNIGIERFKATKKESGLYV